MSLTRKFFGPDSKNKLCNTDFLKVYLSCISKLSKFMYHQVLNFRHLLSISLTNTCSEGCSFRLGKLACPNNAVPNPAAIGDDRVGDRLPILPLCIPPDGIVTGTDVLPSIPTNWQYIFMYLYIY